jgi:hypothetical protein
MCSGNGANRVGMCAKAYCQAAGGRDQDGGLKLLERRPNDLLRKQLGAMSPATTPPRTRDPHAVSSTKPVRSCARRYRFGRGRTTWCNSGFLARIFARGRLYVDGQGASLRSLCMSVTLMAFEACHQLCKTRPPTRLPPNVQPRNLPSRLPSTSVSTRGHELGTRLAN